MTVPLQAGSPRRIAAERFGTELRKAMAARSVGSKTLGPQAGCAPSAISQWRQGNNLPRLETAARLAESLHWPRLLELARAGRVDHCQRCGTEFSNEGGKPKRFCSDECRKVDEALRQPPAGRALADAVRAELDRVHGQPGVYMRRRPLAAALDEYVRSDSKRLARIDRSARQLAVANAAVAAFCAGCEPEGVCRTADCPLRALSPLPLAVSAKQASDARPAEGVHGPSHRAAWLEATRGGNERRWSRPGERERQADETRARWDALTPDERAARRRLISEGRRRPAVAS